MNISKLKGVQICLVLFVFSIFYISCKRNDQNNIKSENDSIIFEHEFVDLDLPSGLKWATCNVGASTPYEYGDYIQWGEVSPKGFYTDENSIVKDNPLSIEGNPNMDSATHNWGGSWHTPNSSDFKELIDNCAWTWGRLNGINGYKIVGKNKKWIFLPASGFRADTWSDHVGKKGYYLCSDLNDKEIIKVLTSGVSIEILNAWNLVFDNTIDIDAPYRLARGKSVRPVTY